VSLVALERPAAASRWCAVERAAGRSLGLVPTMGALHAGHLSLVERARAENDLCVVSVFVNPLQFDEVADLAGYPRDWEGDVRVLEEAGCDLVFTGTLASFFEGRLDAVGELDPRHAVDPGPAAEGLEGACRSGHFRGVATIVARLFELVEPTRAYFGQKDYQQALVVADVARRRGGPEVVVCPISREPSGLARSSRNERLDAAERERAASLSRALSRASHLWRAGLREPRELEAALHTELADVDVEYAALREDGAWTGGDPAAPLERPVALVAARVGPVRLIDNHRLEEEPPVPAAAFPELSLPRT